MLVDEASVLDDEVSVLFGEVSVLDDEVSILASFLVEENMLGPPWLNDDEHLYIISVTVTVMVAAEGDKLQVPNFG